MIQHFSLNVINTDITSQLRPASRFVERETHVLNKLCMCVQTRVKQKCPDDVLNDRELT